MSAYPKMPEIPWARAGLALALLDLDDYAAALDEARRLDTADKTGALGLPVLLAVDRWTTEKRREVALARTRVDALLKEPLTPELRAAALALGGEAAYAGRAWDEAAADYSR